MISASPAWKPQATLTDVASSIIAASLPISQGPKLSPRSELRSTVFMLLLASFLSRRTLPRSRIDGTNRAAGDISIPQGLDVEVEIFNAAQPVGHGAQQLREFPGRGLSLRHADRLEAKAVAGWYLREAAEIGGDHGRDLGVAARGSAVRHQHHRLAVARDLNRAV